MLLVTDTPVVEIKPVDVIGVTETTTAILDPGLVVEDVADS